MLSADLGRGPSSYQTFMTQERHKRAITIGDPTVALQISRNCKECVLAPSQKTYAGTILINSHLKRLISHPKYVSSLISEAPIPIVVSILFSIIPIYNPYIIRHR